MPIISSISSEQVWAAIGNAELYYWPNRSIAYKPWVIFRVIATSRGVAQDNSVSRVMTSVVMPLPPSALNANYAVTYQETELGSTLGLSQSTGVTTAGSSLAAQPTLGDQTAEALRMFGSGASAAGRQVGVEALQGGANILNALNENASDALSAYYRQRLNPRIEQLFMNVQFRSFSYDWDLMPSSEEESRNIETIISIFKFAMLPAYQAPLTGLLQDGAFAYPYEFDILYFDQQYLFRPLRCVLESCDVNYAGSGELAFFRNTQAGGQQLRDGDALVASGRPVHLKMSLKFREIQLLTRDQFAQQLFGDGNDNDRFGSGQLIPRPDDATSNARQARIYKF